MGILKSGVLGPISNKVSNVVFSNWKGINTVRQHTIPANPNTEGQQLHRANFKAAVEFGKLILGGVLQPLWDPFSRSMSGINSFVKLNFKKFATPISYETVLVSTGTLEPIAEMTAAIDSGEVAFGWSATALSNGLSTDKVMLIVVDVVNSKAWTKTTALTRASAVGNITVGEDRVAANLKAYICGYRGAGKTLMVSDSSFYQVVIS